jgi:hypothetical protein
VIINSHPPAVEPTLQLVQTTGQWGGRTPKAGGRLLEDRTWDEMPPLAAARTGGSMGRLAVS